MKKEERSKKVELNIDDLENASGGICVIPENVRMETPGGTSGSGAGISVPETSTLIIEGKGTLE